MALWTFTTSSTQFPVPGTVWYDEASCVKSPSTWKKGVRGHKDSQFNSPQNTTTFNLIHEQCPSLRLGPATSSDWRLRHADRRKKRLGKDAALPLMSAWSGFVCRAAARAARRPEQGPWKLVLMERLHNERGRNLIRLPVGSCLYTAAMKCTLALFV